MEITYRPIGVMHSPLKVSGGAPLFYTESDVKGVIEVYREYEAGLADLDGYGHIVVVFHFHGSSGYDLLQRRRGGGPLKGVFSLRSPNRPNAIGISVLRLLSIDDNMIHVDNVDILDQTPILDIKPYKPSDYPGVCEGA
jgi:tRNA-Thr(GGU) m(6)t(6)A37 methyltransferase TsaA